LDAEVFIEQILASHPKVFGAGELVAFQNAAAGLRKGDNGALPFPELMRGASIS
jgi:hypothetical protein